MIAGLDEAGRGPVIGPIVFGIVLVTEEQVKYLYEAGIDDSKKITPKKRDELKEIIISNVTDYATYFLTAEEIDKKRQKMTMNELEVEAFRKLVEQFKEQITILQLDAADVNAERFGSHFRDLVDGEIYSMHKGDSYFTAVAAASILAKVHRDELIERLQEEMDHFDPEMPSFGSGYPQDAKPFLEAYAAKYKKLPRFVRHSWKTAERVLERYAGTQQPLDAFFDS